MGERLRFKVIMGVVRIDDEAYPNFKEFETVLNDAVAECYIPVFNTFRSTYVPGNMVFSVMVELNDTPEFLGGGHVKKAGFSH